MTYPTDVTKFKRIHKLLILLGVLIVFCAIQTSYLFKEKAKPDLQEQLNNAMLFNRTSAWGDMDGDGQKERIIKFYPDDYFNGGQGVNMKPFIAVYRPDGTEIARTPDSIVLDDWSNMDVLDVFKLDSSNKRDYIKIRQIAGSHHFYDMFLKLEGTELVPVCRKENPENIGDCIFYNTSFDDILVRDLDNDGRTEVTEIVDEYPPGGGRGRPILARVDSFNGKYFEGSSQQDYEKFYKIIADEIYPYSKLMDRKEWGTESIENFKKIKRFWEGSFE